MTAYMKTSNCHKRPHPGARRVALGGVVSKDQVHWESVCHGSEAGPWGVLEQAEVGGTSSMRYWTMRCCVRGLRDYEGLDLSPNERCWIVAQLKEGTDDLDI